ncbi:MAG: isochorismatase family protein [Candidatus Obscuribacterales bacterium]|nr:isochorismatase family protein [Candidatus Obscuribacterales bacterium]
MRHPRILNSSEAVLFIIDVQESFRKVLSDFNELTKSISILIEAAKILEVPVVVTEQYPRGLGKTVEELSNCLGSHEYFEKSCFSALGEESLNKWLSGCGRTQILLSGIETHVCVNQTAHDLIFRGFDVHLITDAVTSRIPLNKTLGIQKIVGSGAVPSSVETALFEMLVESGTEKFRLVQKLVK